MLEWAQPGRHVVCVAEANPLIKAVLPHLGHVYTIRDVRLVMDGIGLHLEEVRNPVQTYADGDVLEPYFDVGMFRPVRETRIDSLRDLLAPVPEPELV